MTEGAYSKVGAKLVQRGYVALPTIPETKRPGERRNGEWIGKSGWNQQYAHRLPTKWEIMAWSATAAGVGVLCGQGSKGLVAVDIDTDEPKIKAAIVAALPPTTLIKRGAKGETRFYRSIDVAASKSWNLKDSEGKTYRVCDFLAEGKFTVVGPTIHPDTGQPYVWTGGVALEDVNPDELPELTPEHVEAIGAALVAFGYQAEPERPEAKPARYSGVPDYEKPLFRQLNDAAMANLDAWVPQLPAVMRIKKRPQGYEAVAVWRASNTGQPIAKRKLNLKFDRTGIVDFGDGPKGYTPLDCVMAALGFDLDAAYTWLSDALGWNSAPVKPLKFKGPSKAPPKVSAWVETTAAKIPPVADNDNDYDAKIERLTHCEGLVGDIIDWIEKSARRPNRALFLGAAVTVIGTLIGRRIAGPTGSATHLYAVALAPTGSGKQHPIDCVNALMMAAGAQPHIGPSEFISMPAVVNMLVRQPLMLAAQDEFGAFLKRINDRRAGGFERGISKILRSLWGISFGLYTTPEWAGRASTPISAPALSVFGLSTPEEFYEGLQSSELKNGFLNRCLVVSTNRGRTVATPEAGRGVPEDIAGALGEIFRWGGAPNSLSTSRLNDATSLPKPLELKWANGGSAEACFAEFEAYMEKRIIDDESADHFMARTAEIAIRLATIRAVGRWGPSESGPTVDRSDVEWGRDLALACGERLAKEATMYMAENERQMWCNRILNIIRKNGAAQVRDIQQSLRGALKSADIKDHLTNLTEAGLVECTKVELENGMLGFEYRSAA